MYTQLVIVSHLPLSTLRLRRILYLRVAARHNLRISLPTHRPEHHAMVAASVLTLDVDKLHTDWEWMLGELREVLFRSGDRELASLLPDSET